MEKYTPGIGISAGVMMLKWDLLNQHIYSNKLRPSPNDEVNIFINFESILENLTLHKNLNDLVNFHKQKLVLELESAILNLMANYKMYFRKEKCKPKIYLYNTSLDMGKQQMEVYNRYYRSYYKNRYMQNPQFRQMGQILKDIIIPEIKLIISYIPDCYFIEANTFDGSLIPRIVSELTESKNVIISSDSFDTLYLFNPDFITLYLKGKFRNRILLSETDAIVQSIFKGENPFDASIFNSEMYYKLLLSVKGSKIRNISSASGFGYGKFLRVIKDGIEKDIVLRNFESIDSVIQLFPEKYQEDIKNAFICTDLDVQYTLLGEIDVEEIKAQMLDKVDVASLEALNNKRFLEFPINLQGLLEQ